MRLYFHFRVIWLSVSFLGLRVGGCRPCALGPPLTLGTSLVVRPPTTPPQLGSSSFSNVASLMLGPELSCAPLPVSGCGRVPCSLGLGAWLYSPHAPEGLWVHHWCRTWFPNCITQWCSNILLSLPPYRTAYWWSGSKVTLSLKKTVRRSFSGRVKSISFTRFCYR